MFSQKGFSKKHQKQCLKDEPPLLPFFQEKPNYYIWLHQKIKNPGWFFRDTESLKVDDTGKKSKFQKVYISLYLDLLDLTKNQLSKNSILEMTKICFKEVDCYEDKRSSDVLQVWIEQPSRAHWPSKQSERFKKKDVYWQNIE